MIELSCYGREISHCLRDGVRRQMSYSIYLLTLATMAVTYHNLKWEVTF